MFYRDTENGRVYRDGGPKLHTRDSHLGFGGQCWRITLADGTQKVTNNLWLDWDASAAERAVPVTLESIGRRELTTSLGICWRCEGTGKHGYRYCPECNANGAVSLTA